MKNKRLEKSIKYYVNLCDRIGNYYRHDFRKRSYIMSKIEFEMFKSWLGIEGDVVFSNVKFFYSLLGYVELNEIEEEDKLRILRLESEVLRNREIGACIVCCKDLIDVMLLLKGEYSEEASREAMKSFYLYCIENSRFILSEECKCTFITASEVGEELERYINLLSCFYLNDNFMEFRTSSIGIFEEFVMASSVEGDILLSFKKGKRNLELSCSYEQNKTKYMVKYIYSYEYLQMEFEIEYQGLFFKLDKQLNGRISNVIRNGENSNGLTTGSKIQDKKLLYVLKKLNDMIEEQYF